MKTIKLTDQEYELLEKILEKKEEKNEGRWKPKEGETYYWIGWCGRATEEKVEHEYDYKMISTGNCYKTEEIAHSISDLKRHVYSFDLLGEKDHWHLSCTGSWNKEDTYRGYHIYNEMPLSSTEEERAERKRLITRVLDLLGYLPV